MTLKRAAHWLTEFAIGPMESRDGERGMLPSNGTRRCVGLKPTTPQRAAGTRIDPMVSDPIAPRAMPSATDTAAPDDEPPGILLRSQGLPGVPKLWFIPTTEYANS